MPPSPHSTPLRSSSQPIELSVMRRTIPRHARIAWQRQRNPAKGLRAFVPARHLNPERTPGFFASLSWDGCHAVRIARSGAARENFRGFHRTAWLVLHGLIPVATFQCFA